MKKVQGLLLLAVLAIVTCLVAGTEAQAKKRYGSVTWTKPWQYANIGETIVQYWCYGDSGKYAKHLYVSGTDTTGEWGATIHVTNSLCDRAVDCTVGSAPNGVWGPADFDLRSSGVVTTVATNKSKLVTLTANSPVVGSNEHPTVSIWYWGGNATTKPAGWGITTPSGSISTGGTKTVTGTAAASRTCTVTVGNASNIISQAGTTTDSSGNFSLSMDFGSPVSSEYHILVVDSTGDSATTDGDSWMYDYGIGGNSGCKAPLRPSALDRLTSVFVAK